MNLSEAKVKYGRLMDGYKNCQYSITLNDNDPDLKPVTINLPEPPDWKLIDNFGYPVSEQKWKAPELPSRLQELQDSITDIDEIWEHIKKNRGKLRDEIRWIKKQWYHILYGYWLFINGTPTWFPPFLYFYLSYFELDVGLPEYRDRDRKKAIFTWHNYTDTTDEHGVDMGHRTSLGVTYSKHRRDGATYFGLSIGYWILMTTIKCQCGIQSFDDDNAEEHFTEKLVPAWQNMPFFLKPYCDSSTNPKKALVFKKSGEKTTGGNTTIEAKIQLGSKFTYARSAKRTAYDGKPLYYIEMTEEGKTLSENIFERWSVVKECLKQGSNIRGFSFHDTTVYECTAKGGENWKKLCKDSHSEERNSVTGFTTSGLRNLFIPAHDGLEGHIDEYGNSVMEDPETPTYDRLGQRIYRGSKTVIQSTINMLTDKNTAQSLSELREFRRLFPCTFADCFNGSSEDVGFPIERINNRLNILERNTEVMLIKGNFDLAGDIRTGKVFFKEDVENGRWVISMSLTSNETNRKILKDGQWMPEFPNRFTLGVDPYTYMTPAEAKIKKENNSQLSDGGGALFMNRDFVVDTNDTPMDEWKTNKFIGTYQYRPIIQETFHKDMLYAAIWSGAMIYCESNIRDFIKYVADNDCGGYLIYDIDPISKVIASAPGMRTANNKQILFSATKNYLDYHVEREVHAEWLMDCKNIRGMEEMGKYDRFTACAFALKGAESAYSELLTEQTKPCGFNVKQFYDGSF
jgi:hypothetical protein